MNEVLENNFTYHKPNSEQVEKYTALRNKAKELAHLIDVYAPRSREQAIAQTNLEQAIFWANAAIARN